MRTEELVVFLSTGAGPVAPHAVARRYALALAGGLVGALTLLLVLLRIRTDLAEAALLPLFWLKIGFVASLLAASWFGIDRLSRPGRDVNAVPWLIALPVLLMWAVALLTLMAAEPSQRVDLFLGATWRSCPVLIAILSIPACVALLWALKGLAPTRPHRAGFSAGLLAGALAALVYSLHCPEIEAPFIGFWYLLGMLIPAAAGAGIGGAILRW